jgi:hypothetical protein
MFMVIVAFAFASPFEKGGLRGISFDVNIKSPLAPLFQGGYYLN